MRLVKVMLFAALVAGWWQLWHVRESITSAYTDDRLPLALELDGVNLEAIDSERPVSPYALVPASVERAPTFLPIAGSDVAENTGSVGVTGGAASLSGSVRLPDGTPVAGATIRIERFTSEGQGTAETVSGSDGSWSASGLRGGRLRIRAFAPDQLASVDPVVIVISRNGSAQLALTVVAAAPGLRFDMVGPPGIAIGTAATAAVVISREVVDNWGRLIQTPVPGRETIASISGARLLSGDNVVTDAGGAVRYLIACDLESSPVVAISAGDADAVLAMPACMSANLLAELEAAAAAERAAEAEAEANLVGPGTIR